MWTVPILVLVGLGLSVLELGPMYATAVGFSPGMGSRQFCRGRVRGRGREVKAEARQGSNVLNRGEARQRQRDRGRGEAD